MITNRIILKGSDRVLLPRSDNTQELDPKELIEVTIRLRSCLGDLRQRASEMARLPLRERSYVDRSESDQLLGARPNDVKAVTDIAARNGLEVSFSQASNRTIKVRVPAGRVKDLFGTDLGLYVLPDRTTYRGRQGPISFPPTLPPETAESIQGVFGLDNRRQAAACISSVEIADGTIPNQFPDTYGLSSPQSDGDHQCIGILGFGGTFSTTEIGQYFGVNTANLQTVTCGDVPGPSGGLAALGDLPTELALDLTVVSQLVPNARIVCYFAPLTEQGWIDAIDAAIHDKVNLPVVLSISWAWSEVEWTQNGIDAVDELLAEAGLLGISVCAASGDKGPDLDSSQDPQVMFPASSRFALTCGGTMLINGQEQVWNNGQIKASGGGISRNRCLPDWQTGQTVRRTPTLNPVPFQGRLVPDVAALADRLYAKLIHVGQKISGTSAAAPLWASLLVRADHTLQSMGKEPLGCITPLLYSPNFANVCTDITRLGNGSPGYLAGPGWDACTGWGSPKWPDLMAAILASA